jgi:2-dehydro-3-deoxyphosphogluconate aldolase / (4S)-4-hydroxy-2-oxoglutarate aldolase
MTPAPTPPPGFDLLAELNRQRILAIVRGHDVDGCFAAAMTLLEEGMNLVEVSLTGRDAVSVLARLRSAAPDALVGAGTVMTHEQVHHVHDSGARFVVTPCLAPSVASAGAVGLPVLCGALTASEVLEATVRGAAAVKVFPASAFGPQYIAALGAPFPRTAFVAVGGVGVDNIDAYLDAGAVAVGLGSPLIGDAAEGGDLGELRRRTRAALAVTGADR